MNITIKKMETDEEIRGRAFVAWHSWRYAYKGIVSQDYLDGMKLEKVEDIAFKFKDGVYVAKDGDKVVGFVSYGEYRGEDLENAGEIYAIYLLEDYWGKGIGARLVETALENLKDFQIVALWVFKDNLRARKFYEKCGFRTDGKENTFALITPLDEIRMTKEQKQ